MGEILLLFYKVEIKPCKVVRNKHCINDDIFKRWRRAFESGRAISDVKESIRRARDELFEYGNYMQRQVTAQNKRRSNRRRPTAHPEYGHEDLWTMAAVAGNAQAARKLAESRNRMSELEDSSQLKWCQARAPNKAVQQKADELKQSDTETFFTDKDTSNQFKLSRGVVYEQRYAASAYTADAMQWYAYAAHLGDVEAGAYIAEQLCSNERWSQELIRNLAVRA